MLKKEKSNHHTLDCGNQQYSINHILPSLFIVLTVLILSRMFLFLYYNKKQSKSKSLPVTDLSLQEVEEIFSVAAGWKANHKWEHLDGNSRFNTV